MNIQTKKLSGAESRKLAACLKKFDDELSLNALKGYFYALATTPALILAEDWLVPLFGEETGLLSEDEWLFESLVRLYNQINQEVVDGSPRLPQNCKLDRRVANNFVADSPLHQWCTGVAWGLGAFGEGWNLTPGSELEQAVVSHWEFLIFFVDESQAREMLKAMDGGDMPLATLAQVVRQQLPVMIKDYAKLSRSIYLNNIGEDEELLADDKQQVNQKPLNQQQGELFDPESRVTSNVLPFPEQVSRQHNKPNKQIKNAEDEPDPE